VGREHQGPSRTTDADTRPSPTRSRPDGRHRLLDLQRQAGNAAVASALQRARGVAADEVDSDRDHDGGTGAIEDEVVQRRGQGRDSESGDSDGTGLATSEVVQRRGDPVPDAAGAARRVLGPLAGDVRVHRAGSGGGPAVPSGALATTQGTDIALAAGAPSLTSPEGQLLLAHESAHVVQQSGATGGSGGHGDPEHEADVAAVAAMAGRAVPDLGRATGPQHFEAPKHQASLATAMEKVGFGDVEQREAYFGNWCRDISQAMVPTLHTTIGVQATMTLVSSLAQLKFGRPVTPDQLGMYDPVEHMDNPAGQIDSDLLQNQLGPEGMAVAGRGAFTTPDRAIGPDAIAGLMQVDDAGVPAYIAQSRGYVKEQIGAALAAGRNQEGLAHVGSFSHVVEDLFAHSNWIEIAFGQLVRDGRFRRQLAPAAKDDVERRVGLGQPPIETYAADVAAAGQAARPVLMTGTFAPGARGHDTLISLKAEVQNMLSGHEPFAEEGSTEKWWDFGLELLQNVEVAAEAGNLGVIFADHVRQVVANLGIGRGLTDATGGLAGSARATFGDGMLGDVAAGAAGLLHDATTATVGAAGEAWDSVVLGALGGAADLVGANIDLVKIAYYLKHGGEEIEQAWGVVKDAVRELPATIRDALLPKLAEAEKAFKAQLRTLLNGAYRRGVETLLDVLEGPIGATDVAESPVFRKVEALRASIEGSDGLRARLVRAVAGAAPGPAGAAVVARLRSAPPGELAAVASSPELRDLLAGLAAADRGTVLAAVDPVRDASERIAQFENMPDWAKPTGSHSQLAKDHADSPFFGAAFKMAHTADATLLGLLRDAWTARGETGRDDAIVAEEEDPGEHLDPLIDTRAMDRERDRGFVEIREMGDRVLATGHAEVQPADALLGVADGLAEVARSARTEADRFPVVRQLAERIDELVAGVRQQPDVQRAEAAAAQLRAWVQEHLDDLVTAGLNRTVDTLSGLLDQLSGSAGHADAHDDAHDDAHGQGHGQGHDDHGPDTGHGPGHADHDHDQGPGARDTESYTADQIRMLNARRGTVRLADGRLAAPGPTALDRRVAATADVEARLYAEVDRIINHPYETTWWREPLLAWAELHAADVSQWILDRNRGRVHSH